MVQDRCIVSIEVK